METTITAQEMKKNKKGANLAASRRTPLLVAGRPVSIALAVSKEDAAKMMQKEAKHWKSNNKEERDRAKLVFSEGRPGTRKIRLPRLVFRNQTWKSESEATQSVKRV